MINVNYPSTGKKELVMKHAKNPIEKMLLAVSVLVFTAFICPSRAEAAFLTVFPPEIRPQIER